MRRSPLHDLNQALGARFTDFGGWEMPLQFGSVIAEHRAVREHVGVFDVSHLGRFELVGPGARPALRHLLCNDIDRVVPGKCQYSILLNAEGGIVDDLIVWWWVDDRFWVMPNAANHDRVLSIFASEPGCHVEDLRETTVLLAVQGPEAPGLIRSILGECPTRLGTLSTAWGGDAVRAAGTGYTGEAGAELCVTSELAGSLLDALVAGGAIPAGLGARDTLRLESGFPLWGQDIDQGTTPLEARLGFATSFNHDFVGKAALSRQREAGLSKRLAGFVLEDRGVPRHGHRMRTESGSQGEVTSGNISPMMGRGIGLGYLTPPVDDGEPLEVEIRDRWAQARIVKPPFHNE